MSLDSRTRAHGITLDEMRLWSDQQKLEFAKKATVKGNTLYSLWNESSHPETLFYDFYDEVMMNLYTPEQKAELLESFLDESGSKVDENGKPWTDLDSFLKENRFLKEDAAEDCYEFNPEWEDLMRLYIFNWLLRDEY